MTFSTRLKRGEELMTRMKTPRKGAFRPHSGAHLKGLYYLSHRSISGEFTLAGGHEGNLGPGQDRIEYFCPECDKKLFEDIESAEAFLLGKKANPILQAKNATEQIEAGK